MDNIQNFFKITINKEKLALEIVYLLVCDLLMLIISYFIAVIVRYFLIPTIGGEIIKDLSIDLFVIHLISNILIIALKGNYPGRGQVAVTEMKALVEAIFIAFFLMGLLIFISTPISNFSRGIFLLSWAISSILVPIGRFTLRKIISGNDWWGEPIGIIGSVDDIDLIFNDVKKCRRLGFRPVIGLYVETNDFDLRRISTKFPYYPISENILKFLHQRNIKTLIVSIPPREFRKKHSELLLEIEKLFIRVIFVLDNVSFGFLWGRSVDIEGRPAFQMQHNLLNPITNFIKKIFDITLSIILLIPIFFVIFIIGILIRLDSDGPIFYTQERIGKNKKPFKIIKFRTMVKNADEILFDLLQNNPDLQIEYEKYHKLENDSRITRVGKWLRRFSLDELPQIINVVKGDMSLIGPRAYMSNELDQIGFEGDIIFRVKPGITGWWQVMGRNETTFSIRKQMDIYYINNWSLWMDLYIFLKTFWTQISGKGM